MSDNNKTKSILKKIGITLGIIIFIALLFVMWFFWNDANSDKYDVEIAEDKIPQFEQIQLDFNHTYNSDKSLPIAPSALIDINGDNVDEVFFGGGRGQEDALFRFRENKFVNISAEIKFPKKNDTLTTTGVVSADFDNNGFSDLIIGREDGLTIYYNENGVFTEKKIKTPINNKSVPAGITVGDIDKDGDLDMYLSTYLKKSKMEGQTIFMDPNYGSTSELLLNDGNENFRSITSSAGIENIHNTFQAILVDIDNDSWLDIIVAQDTGEVKTYKNNGDLTYAIIENPLTNRYAYPMGIAVGDYNNDGLVDFMFSNTGSTLPRFLAKGDIEDASKFNEKWILFKNEGNFKFTDTAKETKIADYEFSWGCTFADLNNDGLQDLMVAENYVDLMPNKIFRLPSRVLMQNGNGIFVPVEERSGLENPHFAITSLVSDFNQDGYLDMIWVNIDTPSLAYLNKGGNNNSIQVDLGEYVNAQGAKVIVTTAEKTLTDWLVTGEGLASDQTALLHFGLGTIKRVDKVLVEFTDGKTASVENPKINSVIKIERQEEVTKTVSDSIPQGQ